MPYCKCKKVVILERSPGYITNDGIAHTPEQCISIAMLRAEHSLDRIAKALETFVKDGVGTYHGEI